VLPAYHIRCAGIPDAERCLSFLIAVWFLLLAILLAMAIYSASTRTTPRRRSRSDIGDWIAAFDFGGDSGGGSDSGGCDGGGDGGGGDGGCD
jgi:uncharacterized membrane protein YgcG